jgi:ribosome-associated protein
MYDKKATDVVVLHVAKLTSIADYLVLASADSDRQTRAIADHVDGILSQTGSNPLSIEGKASSQWVLMDYGDVVVHIFRHDARQHYGLERLWADAKRIPVKEGTPSPAAAAKPARSKRIANSRRA